MPEKFGWPGIFRSSRDALFLLGGRKRVLYVNPAWEALTGLTLAEVRGQTCKRVPHPEQAEPAQVLLSILVPPAEVFEGHGASVRRRVHRDGQPGWWDICFLPLAGEQGPAAILGKITVPSGAEAVPETALPEKLVNLRQAFADHFDLQYLTSDVPATQRVKEQARLAARSDMPILLVGPAGSGKHWLARAIHHSSPRRERTFVRLDCERLAAGTLAKMLFDPPRPPGTVYLRAPGHLPRDVQVRLTAWLADGSAANRPRILAGLGDASGPESGLLPELLASLGMLTITLPALRDRLADLDGLLSVLLPRAAEAAQRPLPMLSPEALAVLKDHGWPGNLRELYDVLVSACARAKEARIEAADLPLYLHAAPAPVERALPLDWLLEQVEKRLILLALRQTRNNKTRAAELLGIWRARLIRRMEGLGLNPGEDEALE